MTDYEHVYYRPWVGSEYRSGGCFGLRTMVLGHSHYIWEKRNPPRDETERITRWYIEGTERKRAYTGIETVLSGRRQEFGERARFWNSILFYNYLQKPLQGPRIAPASAMWTGADLAFREVVRTQRPDFIVVLGEGLWWHLPDTGRSGPPVRLPGSKERETYWYPTTRGRKALAIPIVHPSAPGFSGTWWHTYVRAAMREALDKKARS